MKILIGLLLSLVTLNSHAWTQTPPKDPQACAVHNPYGFPQTTNVIPICRRAYFVGYDAAAKLPKYVTYTLTTQNAIGCVARTNAFAADQSVSGGAKPEDYAATGYDKGHMAPDGDLSWDVQVEYESFLMTNMSPQAGSLNRGIWKLLETSIRGWAVQRGQAYTIYVGSIYNAQDKKIGNGVIVPHSFYKIVVNNTTHEVAGWMFPHIAPYPNLGNNLPAYRVPVLTIQSASGVKFGLPSKYIELEKGKEWPVDYGALIESKRAKCGTNTKDD